MFSTYSTVKETLGFVMSNCGYLQIQTDIRSAPTVLKIQQFLPRIETPQMFM